MARPKKQANELMTSAPKQVNELTAGAIMAMRDEAVDAAVTPMAVDGREVYVLHESPVSLEARIAELEAALRPFAEHGALLRKTDRRGAPRKQLYDLGRSILTLGHFDAARKLIFGES